MKRSCSFTVFFLPGAGCLIATLMLRRTVPVESLRPVPEHTLLAASAQS